MGCYLDLDRNLSANKNNILKNKHKNIMRIIKADKE